MQHLSDNNSALPFRDKISEEEIKNLPRDHFQGRIHLIECAAQFILLERHINGTGVIGFDTETRPSFRKGKTHKVALLQLATENDAFLVRLNKTGFAPCLVRLFENENIRKIGLAIRDDLKSLKKLRHFEPKGFIDLQSFVKDYNILDNGLKKLTANILGFRISKRQQTSNWESDSLSEDQQIYAATDAWTCYKIYKTLTNHSDGAVYKDHS
ncbi:MAG: 3'-5' exonuclease domain-containing protein 2 [Bacteroidales bacterium]|nr:3'-5' exonuclease domain-containing protein 2 [Bacteroidales bacterium]